MRKLIPILIAFAITVPLFAHAEPDADRCSDCHPTAADQEDNMPGPTHISVTTRAGVAHFRRGGIEFTLQPTILALEDLSKEQIDAIRGQPDQLIVEPLHGGDPRLFTGKQLEAMKRAGKLQPGDVVRHGDGPPMTVDWIDGYNVECVWFDDEQQAQRQTFVATDLEVQVPVEVEVDGETSADARPSDPTPSEEPEPATAPETPKSKSKRRN